MHSNEYNQVDYFVQNITNALNMFAKLIFYYLRILFQTVILKFLHLGPK
jgi:hypothetical protein